MRLAGRQCRKLATSCIEQALVSISDPLRKRFRSKCEVRNHRAGHVDPSDIACAKFIQHSWDGYCYFCATCCCDPGAVQAQMHPTPLLLTPSQISEISDQRAAQTNAQPSPTQHDPARPSTTQHGSARLQHGSERPSMAQNP